MTGYDLRRSRAVLLGTWSYESADLPDIPAARNSLNRMHSILTSDLCGWPGSSITAVRNPRHHADLPDRLVQTFDEAEDVALFYFVGHGQVDEDDELCLCMGRTVTQPPRRGTTGLAYTAVRRALQRSPARLKIAILDCCYSGIATERLSGSSMDLAAHARAEGVCTMAASGPYATAWFESAGARPLTYFTKHFAEVVEAGIADEPARLRLGRIFTEVQTRLVKAKMPRPEKLTRNSADNFGFARNVISRASRTDRPVDEPRASDAPVKKRSRVLIGTGVFLGAVLLGAATLLLHDGSADGRSPAGNQPSVSAPPTPVAYSATALMLDGFRLRVEMNKLVVGEIRSSVDVAAVGGLKFLSPAVVVPADTTIDACRARAGDAKLKAGGYYVSGTSDRPATVCLRPWAGGIALAEVSPGTGSYRVSVTYRP